MKPYELREFLATKTMWDLECTEKFEEVFGFVKGGIGPIHNEQPLVNLFRHTWPSMGLTIEYGGPHVVVSAIHHNIIHRDVRIALGMVMALVKYHMDDDDDQS